MHQCDVTMRAVRYMEIGCGLLQRALLCEDVAQPVVTGGDRMDGNSDSPRYSHFNLKM